jgi:hypothetical protein
VRSIALGKKFGSQLPISSPRLCSMYYIVSSH